MSGGAVGDFVTTIHGFCVKFLRDEIYRLSYPQNFIIYDEEDMKALIKEVLEACGFDLRHHHHALADAEACAHIALQLL